MRSFNLVMVTINLITTTNVTELTKKLIYQCALPCQAVQLLVYVSLLQDSRPRDGMKETISLVKIIYLCNRSVNIEILRTLYEVRIITINKF